LAAARALAQRFNPKGNFIRAWGRLDTTEHNNMAIIDSMMNLPLLHWAANESDDEKYRDIAIRHADMALQCFVRADDSVNHAYRFDLATGQPLGLDNYCGCSKDSHWARGATWAIYGFALSYGYTQDRRYLETAVKLAKKFIANLDEEIVPVWDFKLPPDATRERDASAAAIMVCGLQELDRHQAADTLMLKTKSNLLDRLCSDEYLDFNPGCRGVLKKCQTGNGLGKARYSYTSWGDYFLMEAICGELQMGRGFW
jgi:unsaturated chondroitin disaccharide hydrolase